MSEDMKPEGKTAYGVKFSADGSEVCLCGAVCPKEGPARITLIERRPTGAGIRWLSDWLCARYETVSCVVIDGRNGVDLLVDRIRDTWRNKNSVIRPGVKDVIAAASLLTNELAMDEGGKIIINGPMGITTIEKLSTLTAGFLLVMITLVIVFNLINSRTGRAIMAIRDNRIAAESVGVNITKYRMIAFASSAAMAGAAGTLFAMNYSTIIASKFDFNTSILVLVFVVFGGLGNMFGSIVAAAALTILPEALRGFATYRMLIYAIVLILVMLATNSPRLKAMLAKLIPGRKEEDPHG